MALTPRAAAIAAACVAALPTAPALAQTSGTAALPAITVSPRTDAPRADISGFGEVPLRELPASATVIDSAQLQATGARRLADLTALDASVSDAYNAPGYWDFLSVRGFTLDNRFNYRREGLPISAETAIPLDNKERIEILKGTSGIQAGTSTPGGLVNYVVKRPTAQALRQVRIEATSRASVLAAVDISQRFGVGNTFGLRINAAQEQLRPQTRHVDGERSLLAAAADWRITRDTLLEAEVEWSRKRQPSQAAFSLWGSALPAVPDPRLNLNNQPWSQPSSFDALTGSLRLEQAVNAQWRWSAQLGRQSLKTDDRIAFPFGCFDASTGNYYGDRYCPNGSFDLYDFRSENERRRQDAASLNLKGKLQTGGVQHDLSLGVMASTVRNRFQRQAFNYVGSGNATGTAVVAPDPSPTGENTNRDERSLELSVQDVIRLSDQLTGWVGLRRTQLDRYSVRTDGSDPAPHKQGITSPWLALSYKLTPQTTAYASWGRGAESEVVPNIPPFTNSGQALTRSSRQVEVGLKRSDAAFNWSAAVFDTARPAFGDLCAPGGATNCTRAPDGVARHRGLELQAGLRAGSFHTDASFTTLNAERSGAVVNPALNGLRPVNVPRWIARAHAGWTFSSVPGLQASGQLSHEGHRAALPDNSVTLPAWTTLDASLRYDTRLYGVATSWQMASTNLLDKRYWRESPTQFGHAYLYPGATRGLRLTFTAEL